MNTSHERMGAKIYRFPVGGRSGLAGRRNESPRLTPAASPLADIAFGGSWYHEEAIRDERTPKS